MKRLLILSSLFLFGCTSNSTFQAIESQRKISKLQDEVVNDLALNSKHYIFQKLKQPNLTEEDYSNIYNEREAVEKYLIQWERLRTLRMVTVDRKLFDDQGILNVKYKSFVSMFDNTVATD
jgi:hypothetical protein